MRNGKTALIALALSVSMHGTRPPEGVGAAMADGQPEPAPARFVPPRGEWVCIYWNYEGRLSEPGFEPGAGPWLHPIFSEEAWAWKADPKAPLKPYARVVPGDVAGTIVIEAEGTKEKLRGICDIRMGLFRICLSTDKPGAGPPADFEVLPFEKEVTLTYRRVDAPADDRRQSEIMSMSDAILADTAASQRFSKLSMEVAAGRITAPHFESGAAHSDSALLGQLRDSIGIAREKVAADNHTLIEMAVSHLERALITGSRRDRLHQQQRAEIIERMRRRDEAKAERPEPDKP